jgi:hypothetical protein
MISPLALPRSGVASDAPACKQVTSKVSEDTDLERHGAPCPELTHALPPRLPRAFRDVAKGVTDEHTVDGIAE